MKNDWENPYQTPEVLPEPEREYLATRVCFWPKIWISVQLLVVVVGIGLSVATIFSIIGSGLVLSLAGIVMAICAYRLRLRWGIVLGASAPLFSVFIFALINIMEWSPRDAELPVPMMASVYLVGALILSFGSMIEIWSREKSEAAKTMESLT